MGSWFTALWALFVLGPIPCPSAAVSCFCGWTLLVSFYVSQKSLKPWVMFVVSGLSQCYSATQLDFTFLSLCRAIDPNTAPGSLSFWSCHCWCKTYHDTALYLSGDAPSLWLLSIFGTSYLHHQKLQSCVSTRSSTICFAPHEAKGYFLQRPSQMTFLTDDGSQRDSSDFLFKCRVFFCFISSHHWPHIFTSQD